MDYRINIILISLLINYRGYIMRGYQFIIDNKVYMFKTKKNARLTAYHWSKQLGLDIEVLLKSITKIGV